MNRKRLITLAPLLAIAAFAVMPAVAQAVPHVYKNGVIAQEGKIVREIGWGVLHTHSEKLGEVECHAIRAGFEENPTGGGPAKGKVQAFTPYECNDPTCATSLGEIKETAGKLPWQTEASVPKAGEFGEKSNSVAITEDCTTIMEATFAGEVDPHIVAGISIGALPSELRSEKEVLKNELKPEETLELTASAKIQGFGAQELIEVKDP
jgi:hypothetical protein